MELPSSTGAKLALLFALAFCTFILKLVLDSRRAGLAHVPGPFLARYTDLWRFYRAVMGFGQRGFVPGGILERYGEVVRIGPTTVAVFDPAAIPTIYGTGVRLDKGNGYLAFAPSHTTSTLFTNLDEESHARYKRPVASAYSLSAIKPYESNVDQVINKLVTKLNEKAATGEVINLSLWCHYYAYDVIGMLTFGQPLGFLETGKDLHDMIKLQKAATYYAATVSQMPWLDRLFKKTLGNRLGSGRFGLFVKERVTQRLEKKTPSPDFEATTKPDLIAHFISAQSKHPSVMTDSQIGILSAGNLFAGSQSPSHVLDTICNFLATNPAGQDRLYTELTRAQCTYPPPLHQVQHLPYLDGVIREGYRLHGVGFFILERVVPAAGLVLPSGHRLPGGTTVGISSHGVSRHTAVFGDDADEFKPERWIRREATPGSIAGAGAGRGVGAGVEAESQEAFAKRRLAMERCDMTFGHGSRVCIGRNIATLELYKAVATLVGLFEFDLVGSPKMFEVNAVVRRRDKGGKVGVGFS